MHCSVIVALYGYISVNSNSEVCNCFECCLANNYKQAI